MFLHTLQDEKQIEKRKSHFETCVADHNREVMSIVIEDSIQEMVDGNDTIPAVYKKTVAKFKDSGINLIQKIPTFSQKKSSFYRRRNKENQVEKMSYLTDSVTAVEIPPNFSHFLLADFNPVSGGSRILVFCSKEARSIIPNSNIFLSDGTFKICPKPFTQIYTIHADIGSTADTIKITPLIYALLSDKKKKLI